eukprot:jgi/Galph1/1351/GphlegSOOS_G6011.1
MQVSSRETCESARIETPVTIPLEPTTPVSNAKPTNETESLLCQLEELEKLAEAELELRYLESLSKTSTEAFHQKRKIEESFSSIVGDSAEETNISKSPRKISGVTPKLEALSVGEKVSKETSKKLEDFELASLIEEELYRQHFVLQDPPVLEPLQKNDYSNIEEQNAVEQESIDSESGCDINEWVTGCLCAAENVRIIYATMSILMK